MRPDTPAHAGMEMDMKKNPMVASILIGAVLGVLSVVLGHLWSSDWPDPPGLGKLAMLGVVVCAVGARCVYMALVPKKDAGEPTSL